MPPRYDLNDPESLPSPALLIYRPLVQENLRLMVESVGDPARLRPHVKTHKMAAVIRLTEAAGVHKHKAATIAEAEMVAAAGGHDVLLAQQPVGPNIKRLKALIEGFPETTFRTIVDDRGIALALSETLADVGRPLPVLLDLEVGMGRTGIAPGPEAEELYALIDQLPNLIPDGLHSYDGHLHQPALEDRRAGATLVFEQTVALRDRLLARGLPVPRLVLGGTPTFLIHAGWDAPHIECSPGTCTLQDDGYGSKFLDLPFTPAAVLFSRVISRPRPGRLCLDLGHKAVAADPAGPRVKLLNVPDATLGKHNEEHLVVDTPHADAFPVGTSVLAIPTHICPTCALHQFAYVIENGDVVDRWEVTARNRCLTI